METVVCHSESHSVPSGPYIFTVFTAMSHWSGSKPLASATLAIDTGTPGYPVAALCREDPIDLDLQDQPLHILQQFTDGVDVRVGQFTAGTGPGW